MKPADTSSPLALLRRLGWHLAIVTVFNALCALMITHVLHMGGSFGQNLVFSLCIGTLALMLIDGGRMLLWGGGKPPAGRFILLTLVSLPIAQVAGSLFAGWLLGMDRRHAMPAGPGYAFEVLVFTMLAGLVTTWFFWNRGELASLQAEAEAEKARSAAIERQAMQAQLQLLQAQIEPHMLFNTLANLQGLIAIDPPRAQHLLEQLILYLRAALDSSRAAHATLEQEFRLMAAYLELMSVRMGRRLAYGLSLPDGLRAAAIAPMLLQPLVENAIRHGLEPKIEGGRIDISAEQKDGRLLLTVTDTGMGLDAPARHGSGMALDNIRERLLALHGDAARLELLPNTPCGAIAQLTLPMP
jgi:signal transduction histidine kinase